MTTRSLKESLGATTMMDVLRKCAQIISENFGIEVIFKGDMAYTDGRRIIVPALPENAPDDLVEAIIGFIDHEVGHIRHTDMTDKRPFVDKDKRVRPTTNAIEDIRQEWLMSKEYRGVGLNLERTSAWALAKLEEKFENLDMLGQVLVLAMCRAKAKQDQVVPPLFLDKFESPAHKEILDRLDDQIAGWKDLPTTGDAYLAAKTFLKAIDDMHTSSSSGDGDEESDKKAWKKPSEEKKPSKSKSGSKGESGEKGKSGKSDKGEPEKSSTPNDGGQGGSSANPDEGDGSASDDRTAAKDEDDGRENPDPKGGDSDPEGSDGDQEGRGDEDQPDGDQGRSPGDSSASDEDARPDADESPAGADDSGDDDGDAAGRDGPGDDGDQGEPERSDFDLDEDDGEPADAGGSDGSGDDAGDDAEGQSGSGDSDSDGSDEGASSGAGEGEEGDGDAGSSGEGGAEGEFAEGDEPLSDRAGEIVTSIATNLKPSTDTLHEHTAEFIKHSSESLPGYRPYSTEYDLTTKPFGVGKLEEYGKVLEEVRPHINPIYTVLTRTLLAETRARTRLGLQQGSPNTNAMARLSIGQGDVFKHKKKGKELDTYVEVIVDHSGSMQGAEIRLAQQTCIAICEALERLNRSGLKYGISGFTAGWVESRAYTGDKDYPMAKARKALEAQWTQEFHDGKMDEFERVEPLIEYVYKTGEQPLSVARPPLSLMCSQPMGNNADGESIYRIAKRVMARREKRKILIVLSDGQPCAASGPGCMERDVMPKHMQHVSDLIKRTKGLEVIGIGIDSDAVAHYYEKRVVVRKISDLPAVALGQLKGALMGRSEEKVAIGTTLKDKGKSLRT
jgi:cobalamin biosynthesis protein CobT